MDPVLEPFDRTNEVLARTENLDSEPTHCNVEVGLTTIFRYERGKIAEAWMYFDTMGLLNQVGAVPDHPHAYGWEEFGE